MHEMYIIHKKGNVKKMEPKQQTDYSHTLL